MLELRYNPPLYIVTRMFIVTVCVVSGKKSCLTRWLFYWSTNHRSITQSQKFIRCQNTNYWYGCKTENGQGLQFFVRDWLPKILSSGGSRYPFAVILSQVPFYSFRANIAVSRSQWACRTEWLPVPFHRYWWPLALHSYWKRSRDLSRYKGEQNPTRFPCAGILDWHEQR